jgi:hypothetical protein
MQDEYDDEKRPVQFNKMLSSANNSNNNSVRNEIANVSDYQSAQGLTDPAQEIFNSILKANSLSHKLPVIA